MVTRFNFRKVARKFLETAQVFSPSISFSSILKSLSSKLNLLPLPVKTLFGHRGREKQRFQLFSSSVFGERDLLFRDATEKLSVLEDDVDVSQLLGLDYVALLKGLGHEGAELEPVLNGLVVLLQLSEALFCRKFPGGQRDSMVLYQPRRAEEM